MKTLKLFFLCIVLIRATTLFGEYWTAAAQLNSQGTDSRSPSVSTDRIGTSIAVWEEPTSVLSAAVLQGGASVWMPTSPLATGFISGASPKVKHDAKGNAIAVWKELRNNQYILRSATLSAGSLDWTPLGDVSHPSNASQEQHELAVDPAGNAVVVWVERSDGFNKLFGSKLLAGTAEWIESPLPISLPGLNATNPSVGMDGKGTAIAIWRSFKVGTDEIAGAILPSNSDVWTGTGFLGSEESPQSLQLAVSASGKAIAVWAEGKPQKLMVKGAVLTVGGTGWTATSTITSSLALDKQTPKVTVDAFGNAMMAYTGISGNKQVLKAAALPFSSFIWERTFDASPVADTIIPEGIALDAHGIATVIFQSIEQNAYTLKGSTLKKNGAIWKFTNDLSSPASQQIPAILSLNASGAGVTVWGLANNVFANAHLVVYPPENLFGEQQPAHIFGQKGLVNMLSWEAPTVGSPAAYRIFRNDSLTDKVATVPAKKLEYKDYNRKPGKAYTYYIVSEDAFGTRSAPASITVEPKR